MTRRITVFTILITMVYWLGQGGCAAPGEAENYKELKDDRHRPMETNPEETLPGAKLDDKPKPSVVSMDRAAWSPIVIGPRDGRTVHGEIFFRDFPIEHHYAPMNVNDPPMTQFVASLDGANAAGPLNATNLLSMVAQPVKVGVDIVTMPVQAVVRRAWEPQHTP